MLQMKLYDTKEEYFLIYNLWIDLNSKGIHFKITQVYITLMLFSSTGTYNAAF